MNKKISLPELIDLVTKGSNYKRKEIELFLTDLFELIEERIYQDGMVKIKGLGIFKLIPVEERKSVNVNTGAEIIIAAHQKLTFTPDQELKAIVNENGMANEPIETYAIPVVEYVEQRVDIPTDIEKIEEPADEIDDRKEEIYLTTVSDGQVETNQIKEEERLDQPIDSEPEVVTDKKQESKQDPVMLPHDPKHHVFLAEEVERLKKQLNEAQTLLHIPNKKPSFWLGLFAGILFMISVGYTCWYAGWLNLIPDPVSVENMHEQRELESASEPAMSDADLQKLNQPISANLDKVTFTTGMNLFKLSTKYYGHRLFWVYIFDANKEHIDSPNNIRIGTEIVIPRLDSTLIDIKNPEAMTKAKKLQSEYYLKYNLGK